MGKETTDLDVTLSTPRNDASLNKIIRQLRKDVRNNKQRQNERQPWRSILKAILYESCGYEKNRRAVTVRGIDISQGGCALSINRYVARDTTILLTLPLPGDPIVEGQVRYCQLISGRLHRIGVEFIRLFKGSC